MCNPLGAHCEQGLLLFLLLVFRGSTEQMSWASWISWRLHAPYSWFYHSQPGMWNCCMYRRRYPFPWCSAERKKPLPGQWCGCWAHCSCTCFPGTGLCPRQGLAWLIEMETPIGARWIPVRSIDLVDFALWGLGLEIKPREMQKTNCSSIVGWAKADAGLLKRQNWSTNCCEEVNLLQIKPQERWESDPLLSTASEHFSFSCSAVHNIWEQRLFLQRQGCIRRHKELLPKVWATTDFLLFWELKRRPLQQLAVCMPRLCSEILTWNYPLGSHS